MFFSFDILGKDTLLEIGSDIEFHLEINSTIELFLCFMWEMGPRRSCELYMLQSLINFASQWWSVMPDLKMSLLQNISLYLLALKWPGFTPVSSLFLETAD